ncbi:MAG: EAL domain-containing protein [Campylobacterota bacterium]|nr:EAL domain-containing protein [Campylobacterota bacterium]
MKTFRLKLSTKFVLFSIVTFTITFSSIAIYFYIYIHDEEHLKARNNTIKLFSNITQDIKEIENNLIKQTYFLDSEESIIASIYLINTYEHSGDYEKPLIDEEKKLIANKLLKRAKFAFNDKLILFVQDSSIAAGVERSSEHHYVRFISTYIDNKRVYKISPENNRQNTYQYNEEFTQKYQRKHELFYYDAPNSKPQITFNRMDKSIIITAHHSIFDNNESVAHIEISKRFDEHSLKAYNAEKLELTTDESVKAIAVDTDHLDKIKLIESNQSYHAAIKIPTFDGNIYIQLKQPKMDLLKIIKEGKNSFLLVLMMIAFIFIIVMYLFYQIVLIRPLDILMNNIHYIKNREFKYLQTLHSHDELEEIAKNIDHLAYNVEDKEKELQYIAEHDALTHLYNRYHFNHIINQKVATIEEGYYLALIFIDLDEFKSINDTLGHDIGDGLLQAVAKRLDSYVSDNNGYLSRIGGDEFMIILPTIANHDQLDAFARHLQHLFDEAFVIDSRYLKIAISSGIVVTNDKTKSVTTLYKEADIALYKSKERGRNRYTIYQEAFAKEVDERNSILNGLKSAIHNDFDEFYLLYQPKICTQDGKTVSGVEALIRWNSKKLGFIPPDDFIDIAEESGIIIQLGQWIMKQACRDFLKLQKVNVDLKQISINISAIQFSSNDFLDQVEEMIQTIGIDPNVIEFELTERILANDDQGMLFTLNALRKLGIHIAIDDFGTGYSSLSYLQKLPVDRLKIDKSFVTDIDTTGPRDIVEQAILPLARAFHLSTTAEGVETQGEYEILKQMGVDEIQGYYFSKPLTIEKLKSFVKKLDS